MPYTELIAIAALIVAIWQLYLQRLEIKRSTNIQCLQNIAMILKTEIDVIEAMITDRKQKDKSFVNLAARVNNELRPQCKRSIQTRITPFYPSHLLKNSQRISLSRLLA